MLYLVSSSLEKNFVAGNSNERLQHLFEKKLSSFLFLLTVKPILQKTGGLQNLGKKATKNGRNKFHRIA
jgi:hypothetical protein